MRIYPVKIKDETTKKEIERIGLDVEDLIDEMVGLELANPNILENWYSIKIRLIELLQNQEKEKSTEEIKEKDDDSNPLKIKE